MATRMRDLPPPRAGNSLYPWSDWTDGTPWRAVEGEDFHTDTAAFRNTLKSYARRHGLRVTTRREGSALTFRFEPRET